MLFTKKPQYQSLQKSYAIIDKIHTSGVTVFFCKCKNTKRKVRIEKKGQYNNRSLTGEFGLPYLVGGFFAGFLGLSDVSGCKTALDLMSFRFTPSSTQHMSYLLEERRAI